ncbi:hypothetical protein ABI013_15665, partial [Enterococcus faecium]
IGNPSLNHRYRKGFYSLFKTLQQNRRPYNNPGQRQIFAIIESIFFTDKNHYHALDPNRNYHGTYKEDE